MEFVIGHHPHHFRPSAYHVHDLHATMLHCVGVDHTNETYRFEGRDYRLTDAAGNVVKQLLAKVNPV